MSENPNADPSAQRPKMDESWQEVGRQFEALGGALAQAFRATWTRASSTSEAQQVKESLESVLDQVGRAVDETTHTQEAERVKAEARRTVQSLRTAGEMTMDEARPQIVSALRKVNDELQKLIDQMGENKSAPHDEAKHDD
jgi:ABC-type transporter Mla subunit MlaD